MEGVQEQCTNSCKTSESYQNQFEWDENMSNIFDIGGQLDQNQNDFGGFEWLQRDVQVGQSIYKIRCVDRSHQHTLSHTGLMLWRGSKLLARVIARVGASFLQNKFVVELGAGISPLCGLASAKYCRRVLLTDGNDKAIPYLKSNLRQNSHQVVSERIKCCRLIWGDANDAQHARSFVMQNGCFDIVLGADVMYSSHAVEPFFSSCHQLLTQQVQSVAQGGRLIILCHAQRGVQGEQIDRAANKYGFRSLQIPAKIQVGFDQECKEQEKGYFCLKCYGCQC
eukprot:TRINITY_DN27756_c0_g1_i7.p1 TRINITY_DN27756_c0_g1~~TRINITY_DN27756_c0_g1_i7.p1  ORF type:complete len:281 (-),score=32.22 TRINITY_DN27756_c0_g1_i7:151-993(-)